MIINSYRQRTSPFQDKVTALYEVDVTLRLGAKTGELKLERSDRALVVLS